MQRDWKYYPALKLLLPFALGIGIARCTRLPVEVPVAMLPVALALLALAARGGGFGILLPLMVLLLSLGALSYSLHGDSLFEALEGIKIVDAELIGRVAAEPSVRANRVELLIECDSALYRNSVVHPAAARALLRLYDTSADALARLPGCGDHISVAGTLSVPSSPANPGEFDYAAYLRSEDIDLMMTADRGASSVHIFRRGDLSPLERVILSIRDVARRFAGEFVGGREGDIVRALLVGEREYIDAPTRDAFVRTGTVHIFSMNGQRVGIAALALFVVVSWIKRRALQFVVYAVMLAFYGVVAGGGPGIARAVVMASAFMLARLVGRISRPLNTLALAALIILALHPAQLFSLGFQLSFASAAGIALLYRPLKDVVLGRLPLLNRFAPLRAMVQLMLLSVCAQALTVPFALHYFGYLSLTGMLLNIIVMPLASIALGTAIAGAAVLPISPTLASWFGGSAFMSVAAMESVVQWSASWPVTGATVGTVGTFGSITIAIVLLRAIVARNLAQAILRIVSTVVAAIMVISIEHRVDSLRRPGGSYLFCLSHRGQPVVGVTERDTLRLYARGAIAADTAMLRETLGVPLSRRIGIHAVSLCNLDSIRDEASLIKLDGTAEEFGLRDLPVILTVQVHRNLALLPTKPVMLQIPMRARIDEAIVLRYTDRWERVQWR